MKTKSGLPTIAYVLAGILLISGGVLLLARRVSRTEPSTGSFSPSGLRLLSSMLSKDGFEVRATRDPTPTLDPDRDLAIAVFLEYRNALGGAALESESLGEHLKGHAERGGRIITSWINSDFEAATRSARDTHLNSAYREGPLTLHAALTTKFAPEWIEREPEGTDLWRMDSLPWASVTPVGKGQAGYVSDFSGATNRFIDQADNAQIYLAAIRAVALPGSRIVFLEAAWGNASEPGFFEMIGPWAEAGWMQCLFLGLVIAFTLGKPFGLPEARRKRQQGQRELVDAYSGVMQRARATHVALQAVLADADRRVRRAMKLDMGLSKDERNKRMPLELVQLFDRVEMAIATHAPPDIAMGLTDKLDEAVSNFAGDRRGIARKRRKS